MVIPFIKNKNANGESAILFEEKVKNGFYKSYVRDGVVLDIGYKGSGNEPLFTECIGLDTDTPGYDGKNIPYMSGCVGTTLCSHVLEHVADYTFFLQEIFRVLKIGGTLILSVPHKDVYERKGWPPSIFNADHKRFYTLRSLFHEIESSLPRNTYKILFCEERFADCKAFDLPLPLHASGPYEIEIVLEKLCDSIPATTYPFPFSVIPAGSRVVIYGAGNVGRSYYLQIGDTHHCSILFFADIRHNTIRGMPGLEIRDPESLVETDYDYVVVASVSAKHIQEIMDNLARLGVPKEKIIVQGDISRRSGSAMRYRYIDEFQPTILRGIRDGIDPFQGTQRTCGIETGILRDIVKTDPLFRQALAASNNRSIVAINKLINIFLIVRFHLNPDCTGADIVEFGSYKCGSAIFMAYLASKLYPGMNVYALDTFEGMPPTDKNIDWHDAGDFANADLEETREYVKKLGLDNLILVKGPFEKTAPETLKKCKGVCLAHIDCDIYASVAYSYQVVKPHMVDGGYVVFDDATAGTCAGALKAVEDILYLNERKHAEQIYPHMVFRTFNSD